MRDKILVVYTNVETIHNDVISHYKDTENYDKFIFVYSGSIIIEQTNSGTSFLHNGEPLNLSVIKFAYFYNIFNTLNLVVKVLEDAGVICIPNFEEICICSNKMLQQLYFIKNNIPIADSYYMKRKQNDFLINKGLGSIIIKPLSGSCGIGMNKLNLTGNNPQKTMH